ncbi:MAG: hypothetical protein QGI29_05160 [Pirellulales bacterium]|jgi:hypothetical protein|nr:hypothetical protein [Pirellulales bacterium]
MTNRELKKAFKSAGNPARLSEETGIPRRSAYEIFNRGYCSFAQAKILAKIYALDPIKLQEQE